MICYSLIQKDDTIVIKNNSIIPSFIVTEAIKDIHFA
jgi:hypothetical protein